MTGTESRTGSTEKDRKRTKVVSTLFTSLRIFSPSCSRFMLRVSIGQILAQCVKKKSAMKTFPSSWSRDTVRPAGSAGLHCHPVPHRIGQLLTVLYPGDHRIRIILRGMTTHTAWRSHRTPGGSRLLPLLPPCFLAHDNLYTAGPPYSAAPGFFAAGSCSPQSPAPSPCSFHNDACHICCAAPYKNYHPKEGDEEPYEQGGRHGNGHDQVFDLMTAGA